jgi:glycosyltransferase involved in cell wall biosynthesis
MQVLFIHQHFPGQFAHLSGRLARDGHRVLAIGQRRGAVPEGVEFLLYTPPEPASLGHPYLADVDQAVRNGLAVAALCTELARGGFKPDTVVGHSGWGEITYLKDIWPRVPLLGYFEFFYHATGSDMDFDPEFPPGNDSAMRLRTHNAVNLLGLDAADWGLTPTRWQRDQHPPRYRDRLSIIHEGVDCDIIRPDPIAQIWLESGHCLQAGDEVVTFSARNLEPYRGFHSFMRALPEIQRLRPQAHCLILGGDGISYGRPPDSGGTWREHMLAELAGRIDLQRVHFLGTLAFRHYLTVLQLSRVHVYLTYPFVLSWSLLEAMAAGCHIVASRTPPVEEVITDGVQGRLVGFFDIDAITVRVAQGLAGSAEDAAVRAAARDMARRRYDVRTVCLPAQLALLHHLGGMRSALAANDMVRPGLSPLALER